MSNDLTQMLNQWPFHPDVVLVRVISGDDGRSKVQLRVDLGVLQMEMDGRPDGSPGGFRVVAGVLRAPAAAPTTKHIPIPRRFSWARSDCLELWREAVQYYHRYLSFWHLQMYELCARDTARNLRLFAFVRAHASDERHKRQFDQWRPYVLTMHARAVATPLVQQELFDDGLRVIEAGIDAIREFLDEYNQGHRAEECVELVSLERWRDELAGSQQRAAAKRPQERHRSAARADWRPPSPPKSSRTPPGSATRSASFRTTKTL